MAAITIRTKARTRFELINKYNVAIGSLRNQLKAASSIDELTVIAGKIIDLENQIMYEKKAGYQELQQEKTVIEDKIDKARRELARLETDLQRVGNKLDLKVNGSKIELERSIGDLDREYQTVVKYMGQIDPAKGTDPVELSRRGSMSSIIEEPPLKPLTVAEMIMREKEK